MKTTPLQNSPFLTKAAAAAYLGIAQRTLDDWRTAQAIPCIERPGYVRFLQSDLDAFIARHRVDARAVRVYRPRSRKCNNS
jgi:predicted DNA-binding transcriptional regulator AlpA